MVQATQQTTPVRLSSLFRDPVVARGSKKIRERHDRTERALLALANDIVALNEANERVVAQVRALAIEYRIELPAMV